MIKKEISGLIIEKYSDMKLAYTCNRLKDEATKKGITINILGIHDVAIINNEIYYRGDKVDTCDFVINRYKWGKIKHEVSLLANRQYNKQTDFEKYINKYEQIKNIYPNTFLLPKTCLSTATKEFDYLSNILGKPFVAKGLESSQGDEVFLISSDEDLVRLTKEFSEDKEWLFEEFISTSYGRDIRLYSIRGEVVACMKRSAKNGFKANVALGASVEKYEITKEIKQIAQDIYNQTHLDFLGIDLLFGDEKLFFCEINVMPGLEGIEKATGINVAKKIIETIAGDLLNE